MKVKAVHLREFRGFSELHIKDLPEEAKLVVLAGPNGKGKSSVFDAFRIWHHNHAGRGFYWDHSYHDRVGTPNSLSDLAQRVQVELYGSAEKIEAARRKAMDIRSAYRVETDFNKSTIERPQPILDMSSTARMIDVDASVALNYSRLAAQGLEDLYGNGDPTTTFAQYREQSINAVRAAMDRLFPGLLLNGINPTRNGTFVFDKGETKGFQYKNLSGGEKAAFDLLLDMSTKVKAFDDTVFCIDEPEGHLNTKTQGDMLRELLAMLPGGSQLWIATHSIGMMRVARDMWRSAPSEVAFLDFSDSKFDERTDLIPVEPSRSFWERTLHTALDEVAALVAPEIVIICEGASRAVGAANADHDAACYNTIFSADFPEAKFVSGGNSHDVESDRLALMQTISALVKGTRVIRLIDRDGMLDAEVSGRKRDGIAVLSRRHLECYLFADEILRLLCHSVGKPEIANELIAAKQAAIMRLSQMQRPIDDLKSASRDIFVAANHLLGGPLGKSSKSFARLVLAPLVTPGTETYVELRADIFGSR